MDKRILKYFKQETPEGPVIFDGELCEVQILKKFEQYGCLTVSDSVKTIGVFDMVVDGIQSGMFLVAHITMHPSNTENTTGENETPIVKLTFKKGDVFMDTTQVVIVEQLAFPVYIEYIKYANRLKAFKYEDYAFIFDRIMKTSGLTFRVDHVVFEAMAAHLTRDANDFSIPFRNTDMKGESIRIPISEVAHAATSTAGKIIGAYFNDGVNAALVNQSDEVSPYENVLSM